MSPPLAVFLALISVALVHALARLVERAGPDWIVPARAPLWVVAALLIAAGGAVAQAAGASWLAVVAPRLGIAESGAAGAVAALALSLAALLVVTVVLHLLPTRTDGTRAPARRAWLMFGIAADGSGLEGARRPLRWGLHGMVGATVAGLGAMPSQVEPLTWASAVMVLVALTRATARPLRQAPSASPEQVAPNVGADRHAELHRALGSPPLFEREPAVSAPDRGFVDEIVAAYFEGASPRLLAVSAPLGAGKRRAAGLVAERLASRGLVTVFVCERAGAASGHIVGAQSISMSALADVLAAGTALPRLGLVVLDAELARSGEALARLRFGMHRLRARSGPVDIMVIGERPSVATVARAVGAAEPRVVTPRSSLPTRPILRYLLAGAPDPALAASPPEDTRFVVLDRPAPLARYAEARDVAREYLVPVGGPLGRRMREDRAASLVGARAARLLLALPGDREVPERHDGLARFHLRAALAEGPQDAARLRTVFSAGLVDSELASLARAGLLVHVQGWTPTSGGLVAAPKVCARLPSALAGEGPATTWLVEPRSGAKREVGVHALEHLFFDGAIMTLDAGPAAARFEVRAGVPARVLVPTTLVSATPLRRLTITLAEVPKKTRLRFRGPSELGVWEGLVDVHALHLGVRQFAGAGVGLNGPAEGSGESRAYTRLLPEPRRLEPFRTNARMLVFDEAPSTAALHAIVHALREVLPCFFDNAADLQVTYSGANEGPGGLGCAAIVFFDVHSDGLGACADLRDDDLEALVLAACELLECECAAHCAQCCESTRCTDDGSLAPLDRREALRVLSEVVMPRPIALGARSPRGVPLRRTA